VNKCLTELHKTVRKSPEKKQFRFSMDF